MGKANLRLQSVERGLRFQFLVRILTQKGRSLVSGPNTRARRKNWSQSPRDPKWQRAGQLRKEAGGGGVGLKNIKKLSWGVWAEGWNISNGKQAKVWSIYRIRSVWKLSLFFCVFLKWKEMIFQEETQCFI